MAGHLWFSSFGEIAESASNIFISSTKHCRDLKMKAIKARMLTSKWVDTHVRVWLFLVFSWHPIDEVISVLMIVGCCVWQPRKESRLIKYAIKHGFGHSARPTILSFPLAAVPAEPPGGARSTTTYDPGATVPTKMLDSTPLRSCTTPPAEQQRGGRATVSSNPLQQCVIHDFIVWKDILHECIVWL